MKRLATAITSLAAILLTSVSFAQEAPGFEPSAWNAEQVVNRDGTITARINGGWQNYLTEDDTWEPIDTLVRKVDDGWTMDKAPFTFNAPEFADGEAYFESTNRWDVTSHSKITDDPMGMFMRAVDAEHVQGKPFKMEGVESAVIYENAFPALKADLIYYVHFADAPKLEKLVRFNSAPSSDVDLRFLLTFSDQQETEIAGKRWNKAQKKSHDVLSFKKTDKRGIGLLTPLVWDSATGKNHKSAIIDYTVKQMLGGILYTKHVPKAFFATAALPVFTDASATFYPDPNAESTSVDGQIGRDGNGLGTGSNWSTQYVSWDGTGDGGAVNDSSSSIQIRIKAYTVEFGITRSFILFDTSSLGAGSVVSAATLSLFVSSKTTGAAGDGDTINLFSSAPASNTALALTDFNDVGSTKFVTGDTAFGSISTSAYHDMALNASGLAAIEPTGISKFSARIGNDYENNDITHIGEPENSMTFASAETANTTSDPKLFVTYTAPAGSFKPRIIYILMDLLIPSVYAH